MLPTKLTVTFLSVLTLIQQCFNSPVYTMQPAFITANIGTSGRNIRHLPCVSRRTGQSGTCMFAIDCLKSNGTHLGTCIDRFYFGSCCHIELSNDINENVISDSALLPDRHPPHRVSNTSSTSNTKDTMKPLINSSTEKLMGSTFSSTTPSTITTNTTKVISIPSSILDTLSTASISSTSSSNTTKKPTTITRKPVASATTPPYKLSTFQSIELITSSTPTIQSKPTVKPTLKPTKTTLKPTKLTTSSRPTQTRPRPSSSSSSSSSTKPTTRPSSSRPSISSSLKPSTNNRNPVRTTSKPTTKPISTNKPSLSTKPLSSTSKSPTKPIRPGSSTISLRTTTAKPNKTTTHKTTSSRPISTTQKTASTSKLSTESRTTPSRTTLPSTTTYRSPTSSTTQSRLPTTSSVSQQPSTASLIQSTVTSSFPTVPNISNEIFSPSTRQPIIETVNGNTATNEIEPIIKPFTEKEPQSDGPIFIETTSQIPALITWAVVNSEVTTKDPLNNTSEDLESDWTPVVPPDGWVLLPSVSTTQSESQTNPPSDFSTFSSVSSGDVVNNSSLTTTTENLQTNLTNIPSTNFPTTELTSKLPDSTTDPEKVSGTSTVPTLQTESQNVSSSLLTISSGSSFSTMEPTIPTTSSNEITPGEINKNTTMELVPLVNASSSTSVTATISTTESTVMTLLSSAGFDGPTPPPVNMSDFTDVCGRRMYPEPRIVGGEKSSFGKWPWQISLRQWKTSTYLHKCGAALLNENWAITAAHCVDNVPPSDLLLRLGEHDLSTDAEPYIHQERRVQIVASHPQFDPRTFEYDLALLRFYEPVQFQPNIIPVCVPQNDETFVGRDAFVTGWGRLYEDGPLPSILQEVSVPVINNTVCEAMYRNAGYIEHIPNIFICAGWKHGGFDSCEGDSGGPMVIQRPDKRFLLAGIISWGIGCAEPNQPGVYTRISEFRDWINQILQF